MINNFWNFLRKEVRKLLNIVYRKKDIKGVSISEIDLISSNFLNTTKYIVDIDTFLTMPQDFKNRTYLKLYQTNPIVRSFIDMITNLTLDLLGEYYNSNKEIEEYIKEYLKNLKFRKWLRQAILDYFIFGFTCSLINLSKLELRNLTYYVINYDNGKFYTTTITRENGENVFDIDELIYLSNTPYLWNGISILLPLISYYNLFSKIMDGLYTNISRFTLPYFVVKIKDPTLNKDYYEQVIKQWIQGVINGEYRALAYQESELEFEFLKPANIINELLKLWDLVDKYFAKAIGIYPAISSGERGGSYATAKTQKEILMSFLSSFLDEFIEEVLNKLIKTLIQVKYGIDYKDDIGGFEIRYEKLGGGKKNDA